MPSVSLAHIKTILVADDSEMERESISSMLWSHDSGILIKQAKDGLEAYQQVVNMYKKGQSFHVLIMDINMPNSNGWDAVSHIRDFEKSNGLKRSIICLLSADDLVNEDGEEDFWEKLEGYGIQKFMTKPMTRPSLVSLMQFIETYSLDN